MTRGRCQLFGSLAFLLVAGPVLAARFTVPDKDSGTVNATGAAIADDFYATGANVLVGAPVLGDVYAAGGHVEVSGRVEGDAVLAGGSVVVSGNVGDDLRVVGGTVLVSAPVAGDLLAGGGNVHITAGARVGGDLLAGAGQVVIQAPVAGKVRVRASEALLDAAFAGPVEVYAARLELGPSARLTGPLVVRGPKPPIVRPGAQVGVIDFQREAFGPPQASPAQRLLAILLQIVMAGIAGLVLVRVAGPTVQRAVEDAWQRPWRDLGLGFAAGIVVPVALVVLLVSVLGTALALLAGAAWLLMVGTSLLVAAVLLGASVRRWLGHDALLRVDAWSMLLGVVLAVAIGQIPWVGPLLLLVPLSMALGGLLRLVQPRPPEPRLQASTRPTPAALTPAVPG